MRRRASPDALVTRIRGRHNCAKSGSLLMKEVVFEVAAGSGDNAHPANPLSYYGNCHHAPAPVALAYALLECITRGIAKCIGEWCMEDRKN
jgi:hypothetical protein